MAARLIALSSALFLLGLPYVTRGGYSLLEISDHFVVTYILLTSVLAEYLLFGYKSRSHAGKRASSHVLRTEIFPWCEGCAGH